METLRLFWAVSLPDELRHKIAQVQETLRKLPLNVKWVEVENLHLTIRFLGATPKNLVEPLVAAVRHRLQNMRNFTLSAARLGVFPSFKEPRVLWIGVEEVPSLSAVHQLVAEAVASLGLPPDDKKFSPHITIGRFRTKANGTLLRQVVAEIGNVKFGTFEVQGVELFASELTQTGPIYSLLARVNFGKNSG